MSICCAAVEAIEAFIKDNDSFCSELESLDSTMYSELQRLLGDARDKADRYRRLVDDLMSLLSEAETKLAKVRSDAAKAASAASSTPKTLTKTYTGEDGQKHEKKVENPAYAAAQAQAEAAKKAVAAAESLVQSVRSALNAMREKSMAAGSVENSLNQILSIEYPKINRLVTSGRQAADSAKRAEQAVKDYMDVTIR